MVVIYGTRVFGEVDKTPGVGAVSTEFIHVYYCPIVPLGSYFVGADDGDEKFKLRMNWKSVLVAWARAALIVGFLSFAILSALEFSEGAQSNGINAMLAALFTIVAFDFLRSTHGIGQATEAKTKELSSYHQAIGSGRAEGWRSRAA